MYTYINITLFDVSEFFVHMILRFHRIVL